MKLKFQINRINKALGLATGAAASTAVAAGASKTGGTPTRALKKLEKLEAKGATQAQLNKAAGLKAGHTYQLGGQTYKAIKVNGKLRVQRWSGTGGVGFANRAEVSGLRHGVAGGHVTSVKSGWWKALGATGKRIGMLIRAVPFLGRVFAVYDAYRILSSDMSPQKKMAEMSKKWMKR